MEPDKKNTIGTSSNSTFARIEKVHPFLMMLYLVIVGISVMFLILMVAYIRTRILEEGPINRHFSKFFSISTILLICSSFTISRSIYFYLKDDLFKLKAVLWATLLLGMAFVWSQIAGWRDMDMHGIPFRSGSGTYVYLISALHSLHLLGGFGYLSFMLLKTLHASLNPIRSLVFIRNPYRRQQLTLLCTYWHFMDILWVCIYLLFLFFN
ncbi:cytochrome c oxidase subunit 3 [Adhaeribacter radiodurans]|uniref:Cytochrome c oxidase subunit III n=1 Tax=Adhaeribacter radiodurans TaxID=2745197 RepID=A0A7L7L4P9_9BACT|nr:cytochrome c oxidase subunit III [Adhaeribacter radiodurans]QMU27782.1 cytochrome c oxidase subunit III [Adhaeribacter radiodurans]